jgi:hypothetical protein
MNGKRRILEERPDLNEARFRRREDPPAAGSPELLARRIPDDEASRAKEPEGTDAKSRETSSR